MEEDEMGRLYSMYRKMKNLYRVEKAEGKRPL